MQIKKKDRKQATKVLEIKFGLYLERKSTKDTNPITLPLAEDQVSESVRDMINVLCNGAMETYNETHINMVENTNCTPVWRHYPYNIFLDNQIGSLRLVYKEGVGKGAWRYRFI